MLCQAGGVGKELAAVRHRGRGQARRHHPLHPSKAGGYTGWKRRRDRGTLFAADWRHVRTGDGYVGRRGWRAGHELKQREG